MKTSLKQIEKALKHNFEIDVDGSRYMYNKIHCYLQQSVNEANISKTAQYFSKRDHIKIYKIIQKNLLPFIDVSILGDRVAIINETNTLQLFIPNLTKRRESELEIQIDVAFALSLCLNNLITHLKLNNFDARIEDIHENKTTSK